MKLHIIKDQKAINYPVGYYIQDATCFIGNAVKVIMEMVQKKQFPYQDIDIWVRGSSGAILGGLLTQRLLTIGFTNISVIHIKKEGEDSHTENVFRTNGKYNIIIDDFIASGETMNEIAKVAGKYVKKIDLLIVSRITFDYNHHFDEEYNMIIDSVVLSHFTPKTLICGVVNKRYIKHLRQLKPTNINKL